MPAHDDPHRGNDEAHVHSLRLALGTILSPKRPQITRSSTTTSGTASPALHCPHSAIPLSPSLSASHAHSTPNLTHPHTPVHPHAPHLPHAHAHAPHHPSHLHPHAHSHPHPHYAAAGHPAEHAHAPVPALDTATHLPDAIAGAGATPGSMTPGARAHFVETLQSKKSWDALVHGAWM